MREIFIGISPCPNDTFIFGALYKGFVDTTPYKLNFILEDVETLNKYAHNATFDVIKVSVANYKFVKKHYFLLKAGSALGRGVGPLVVARNSISAHELKEAEVAIPGRYTTAAFLFKFFFKHTGKVVELSYDRIITEVLEKRVKAGILIHETRFVYSSYGLVKIADLGEMWEQHTSFPLPLGVILAKRELGSDFCGWFEGKIRESIRYAQFNRDLIWDFIKENAQEMDDNTINTHIDTFVNEYSYDLKKEGEEAILKLLEEG